MFIVLNKACGENVCIRYDASEKESRTREMNRRDMLSRTPPVKTLKFKKFRKTQSFERSVRGVSTISGVICGADKILARGKVFSRWKRGA